MALPLPEGLVLEPPPACPTCQEAWHIEKTSIRTRLITLQGHTRLRVPTYACTRHTPSQRWTPPLEEAVTLPHQQVTMDVRIAVGLLRFGLDLRLKQTRKILAKHGIHLSLACLSNLSDEFLIRWSLFTQDTRPVWAPRLQSGFALMLDATHVNGGPATMRALDARSGVTIHAAGIPSENEEDIVAFLEAVKALAGVPWIILRDMGSAIKAACLRVFPGVPHQVCHFHFLREAGKNLLEASYGRLKDAIVATEQLPALQRVVDALAAPTGDANGVRRALSVFTRLALEHVVSARDSVGGFPFRLAYHTVAQRVRDARAWMKTVVVCAMRFNVCHPHLLEAKTRLDALGEDADVKPMFLRVDRLYSWFLEVRGLMRLERDLNDGDEPPPLTRTDRDTILARVNQIRGEAAAAGAAESAAWERVADRFRAHEDELWVTLDVKGVGRTTNPLEGRHREDRRRIRRRTGRHATSDQMERVGEHLALWSNARNPWFIRNVLENVDLRRIFLAQDAARVEAGVKALRAKRWRGRLPVRTRHRQGLLEEFARMMGSSPDAGQLVAWADRVEGVVAATGV